jgi:Flp pilus assembly protein TadG
MNAINSPIACAGTKRSLSRRSSRSLRRRRHGAIAVEFAIVSPLVFMVIGLLMQFSGLAMSQNVITNAAHEGGRRASLRNTVAVEDVISQVEATVGSVKLPVRRD